MMVVLNSQILLKEGERNEEKFDGYSFFQFHVWDGSCVYYSIHCYVM